MICGFCSDQLGGSNFNDPNFTNPANYPFTYADGVFEIDLVGAGAPGRAMQYIDPVTGSKTLRDVFLRVGDLVNLYLFNDGTSPLTPTLPPLYVLSRGSIDPTTGNLQSIQVGFAALPTSGNVYPNPSVGEEVFGDKYYIVDDIVPDTQGLPIADFVTGDIPPTGIAGVGIPAGATVTEILDLKRIGISAKPTVAAAIHEALTFSYPAFPAAGFCDIAPCLTNDGPFNTQYRTCPADPSEHDHDVTPDGAMDDVTSRFSGLSFQWIIDLTIVRAGLLGAGPDTFASTVSASGASTLNLVPSANDPARPGAFATVSDSTGPGLISPGEFRVYKCSGCCESCFYFIIFNLDGLPMDAGTLTGSYSDTTGGAQTMAGTFNMSVAAEYGDAGLLCYPFAQDAANPETLSGAWDFNFSAAFTALTFTGSGPLAPPSLANNNAVMVNTCDLAGTFEIDGPGETTTTDGATTTTTTDIGQSIITLTAA
jgi:hypothetical protein